MLLKKVVLLAAEILTKLKPLVEEGISPTRMIQSIRKTGRYAIDRISALAVAVNEEEMLLKCAGTALNSKLISSHRDLFAPMVVSAVTKLHQAGNVDELQEWISIKQIPGGDVRQSFLVEGVAFKKTFFLRWFRANDKAIRKSKNFAPQYRIGIKIGKGERRSANFESI